MASVELVGRLLVSLAVVLGLMWVVVRRMRGGKTGRAGRTGKLIEVLDRASLTRSASVAVVRVNGQAFVLGVAEQGVTILGETDLAEAQAAQQAPKQTAPARTHRAVTHRVVTTTAAPAPVTQAAPKSSPLAGSALSPQTWRQTVESLRDLTARG